MSRTPQVTITLAPDGSLQAEIPTNGGRRHVPIESLDSIVTILCGQLRQTPSTIGLDGSPTIGQVRHWEKHSSPDPQCPWCIAASMGIDTSLSAYKHAKAALRNARRIPAQSYRAGDGSVKVTYLKPKTRKIKDSHTPDFSAMFLDDDESPAPSSSSPSFAGMFEEE